MVVNIVMVPSTSAKVFQARNPGKAATFALYLLQNRWSCVLLLSAHCAYRTALVLASASFSKDHTSIALSTMHMPAEICKIILWQQNPPSSRTPLTSRMNSEILLTLEQQRGSTKRNRQGLWLVPVSASHICHCLTPYLEVDSVHFFSSRRGTRYLSSLPAAYGLRIDRQTHSDL